MKFDLEKMIGKKINCDTEEKTKQLFIFLDNQGYKWWGGGESLINSKTNWERYERNTCYCIDKDKTISFCDTKYSEYETLNFEDVIIPDKPRICEILGVELNKPFNIKGWVRNPYTLKEICNTTGYYYIANNAGFEINKADIMELIEHPKLIEKIPEWTNEQKEIFKALKILGYRYITRDKAFNDDNLNAYSDKPNKSYNYWIANDEIKVAELNHNLFPFIDWEDDEPFEIPEV